MSKHTPGPWKVNGFRDGEGGPYDHAGEEPGSGRYAHLDRIIAKATGATP